MQLSIILLSSMACLATPAPHPLGPGTLAYFNLLGQRFEMLQGRRSRISQDQDQDQDQHQDHDHDQGPVASCNNFALSTAQFPSLPSGLPAPSGTTYHVAIGHGTQNYTCAAYSKNSSAVPVQIGATASLFNLSCGATIAPSQTNALPPAVIEHPSSSIPEDPLFPGGPTASMSGYHYFADATTPIFNLNMESAQYGITFSKLATKVPAPVNTLTNGFWPYTDHTSSDGPHVRNTTAVPWLKLTAQTAPAVSDQLVSENTGGVTEIYRINTAGGSPPKDCSGFPDGGDFELPYAAEYWFFA